MKSLLRGAPRLGLALGPASARAGPEHGCRKGGTNLKISAKKVVFLLSSDKNRTSPLLLPHPKKTFGKIH